MNQTPHSYYQQQVLALTPLIEKVKHKISYLYVARLITFVIFIALFALSFQSPYSTTLGVMAVLFIILFLLSVKYNLILIDRAQYLEYRLTVNRKELKILEYQYEECDTGLIYSDLNPYLVADFDIMGRGSLYQYINRSVTLAGQRRLAEGLCSFEHDKRQIEARQEAIRELAGDPCFIQDFQAHGMFLSENGREISDLQLWMLEHIGVMGGVRVLIWAVPLLNISWIALIVATVLPISSLMLPILISLMGVLSYKTHIEKAHARLGRTAQSFKKYAMLIALIEKRSFNSHYLQAIHRRLVPSDAPKAGESLRSLFRLLNSFDMRYNVLVSFILNALIGYDLQMLARLDRWRQKHRAQVGGWFDALSDIDSLLSFAVYSYNNHPTTHYPHIEQGDFRLAAVDMGHPLLSDQVRVSNSLSMRGVPSVMIVTGANMAGKSTFLRTVVVNLILGMNGAPVCAREFSFTPCDIMSSIKIQDSLSNNESYFYAELLRLKDILDHLTIEPHTLVILDEILRGTNTRDKQQGSIGILEKLISISGAVIVATHDLVIGELESRYPSIVSNYCFEVELTDDQLIFDYKLKPGISQKLNASYLMKKMEIIA